MSAEQAPQTHKHVFQTEVSQLLHLMVHSVYTEKEVFLRELISNASDACDKLRYEAIAQPGLLADDARLAIRISFDKSAGTLTVADNGIGMNEQELIDNLGTIARSGTRAFLERMTAGSEGSSLIGQFGVGFYSAFMVADRIDVVSRKAGEDRAWLWVSDGASGFTVTPAPEAPAAKVSRGTSVTLALKQDARNFLEDGEIERIVRTYSDHILFPIEFTAADGNDTPGEFRQRAVAALQIGGEARGVQGSLQYGCAPVRRAGADPALQGRGPTILCGSSVCTDAAAVRPVRGGAQRPREALRAARLHH